MGVKARRETPTDALAFAAMHFKNGKNEEICENFKFSVFFSLSARFEYNFFLSSSRRSARLFDRAFVQSSFSFDRDCVLVSTNLVRNESSSTGICARVLPIHMRIFCFEKFFERSDRFFFLIISLLSFQLLWGGKVMLNGAVTHLEIDLQLDIAVVEYLLDIVAAAADWHVLDFRSFCRI